MKKIIVTFLVIPLFLAACSGSSDIDIPEEIASLENLSVIEADAGPLHSISLPPAASYGDTEDVIIGQMGQFSVDQTGRVYIADFSQNVIHAYEPDGSYLRQIGREGAGSLDEGLINDDVVEFREMGYLVRDDGMMNAIPFGRTTLLARGHDGKLYMTWNEDF